MSNDRKKSERRQWVWIMLMVDIVFVLLLMTLGIIALQVGNGLPDNTDVLFIVGKNYSVDVDDESGKTWSSNNNIQIFQASYVNDQGVATVKSSNGQSVFAPGTTTTYSFAMHNNGNAAVIYQTNVSFVLSINNSVATSESFQSLPILARLYYSNANGETIYLIGDEAVGVPLSQALASNVQLGTLGASSYQKFNLELTWPFEGNDDVDTLLGDLAANRDNGGVAITMKVSTYAEAHPNTTAEGGIKVDLDSTGGTVEQGGTIRWLWLVLLMLNAAVIIFYVAWLLNKRANKF